MSFRPNLSSNTSDMLSVVRDVTPLGSSTAKLQPTIRTTLPPVRDTRPPLPVHIIPSIRHTQLLQITLVKIERMQAVQACRHHKQLNNSPLQIKGNHMSTNETSTASHNKNTLPQHQVGLVVSTFRFRDSHKSSSRVLKNAKRAMPNRPHDSLNRLPQVHTDKIIVTISHTNSCRWSD
jgi:hypothetical protein